MYTYFFTRAARNVILGFNISFDANIRNNVGVGGLYIKIIVINYAMGTKAIVLCRDVPKNNVVSRRNLGSHIKILYL